MTNALSPKRRLFAPEVVQTSAMDCGPAALKCLLEGFGIPVSYGRLRLAFLTKIPRLGDRYFQSRLISDMAERAQSAQFLRQLPQMGGRFVRASIELTGRTRRCGVSRTTSAKPWISSACWL